MEIFECIMDKGRSLIYMRNRRDPRYDPCGTPMVIYSTFESVQIMYSCLFNTWGRHYGITCQLNSEIRLPSFYVKEKLKVHLLNSI